MLSNMKYKCSTYCADGSTYIRMETANGEPWCDVSICLKSYDLVPEDENHIFIPTYKMDSDTLDYIKSTLVKQELCPVTIGYGTGIYVRLVDNWKEICEEL